MIGKVASHRVDAIGKIFPSPGDPFDHCLTTELSFRPDLASNACNFTRKCVELIDHDIDGILQLQNFAAHIDCYLTRQVSVSDRRSNFRNITDLRCKIARH